MGTLTSIVLNKLVAFDTAPLIYFLEEHPQFFSPADELFDAIHQSLAGGMTSVLSLAEVLVKPLREGRTDLANQYRRLLTNSRGFLVYPITESICESAAILRATHEWLRTPDALQVATALEQRADMIATNDDGWKRLTEIPVIVLRDYVSAKL